MSFQRDRSGVLEWQVSEVCDWIRGVYHHSSIETVLENIRDAEINGSSLIHLPKDLLLELGMNKFHVPAVLHEIEALRERSDAERHEVTEKDEDAEIHADGERSSPPLELDPPGALPHSPPGEESARSSMDEELNLNRRLVREGDVVDHEFEVEAEVPNHKIRGNRAHERAVSDDVAEQQEGDAVRFVDEVEHGEVEVPPPRDPSPPPGQGPPPRSKQKPNRKKSASKRGKRSRQQSNESATEDSSATVPSSSGRPQKKKSRGSKSGKKKKKSSSSSGRRRGGARGKRTSYDDEFAGSRRYRLGFYETSGVVFEDIPRVDARADNYDDYFQYERPVIIQNTGLVADCGERWTPDYFIRMLRDHKCKAFQSNSRYFRYWDTDKNSSEYNFTPPTQSLDMTFEEFARNVVYHGHVQDGDTERSDDYKEEYYYLQTSLGDFAELADDFTKWNWEFLFKQQRKWEWGPLTTNLLLVGMKGNCTPLHFDEQENLFVQCRGLKEVRLFPPSEYVAMYPFPFGHPCDRQAMVSLANPNLTHHPRIASARGFKATLREGDCLYLPRFWFHEFTNLTHFCTSVTFWSKPRPIKDEDVARIQQNVTPEQRLKIGRNIEKLVSQHVGGSRLKFYMNKILEGHDVDGVRSMVSKLLGHIFHNEADINQFLDQLIRGRYNVNVNDFVEPSQPDSS